MKKLVLMLALIIATLPTAFATTPAENTPVLKVTNSNFEQLASTNKLLVIDFWAPWCGPCRALTPIIEELAKEYAGKVAIGKCNVDENRELTGRFGVQGIPAIFLLKNGKIVDQQVGYCQKDVLKAKIEKLRK